jgi:hypothetical protein
MRLLKKKKYEYFQESLLFKNFYLTFIQLLTSALKGLDFLVISFI